MVGTVFDCTKDEVLVFNTNGGSKNLTKITSMKLLSLDININKYFMANILSLKNVAFILVVFIMVES